MRLAESRVHRLQGPDVLLKLGEELGAIPAEFLGDDRLALPPAGKNPGTLIISAPSEQLSIAPVNTRPR